MTDSAAIKILERRKEHLLKRIKDRPDDTSLHFVRAEIAALEIAVMGLIYSPAERRKSVRRFALPPIQATSIPQP